MMLLLVVLWSRSSFGHDSPCVISKAHRRSVWLFVEPVEISRTSYEVLVRGVSNSNIVESQVCRGFLVVNKSTYVKV